MLKRQQLKSQSLRDSQFFVICRRTYLCRFGSMKFYDLRMFKVELYLFIKNGSIIARQGGVSHIKLGEDIRCSLSMGGRRI